MNPAFRSFRRRCRQVQLVPPGAAPARRGTAKPHRYGPTRLQPPPRRQSAAAGCTSSRRRQPAPLTARRQPSRDNGAMAGWDYGDAGGPADAVYLDAISEDIAMMALDHDQPAELTLDDAGESLLVRGRPRGRAPAATVERRPLTKQPGHHVPVAVLLAAAARAGRQEQQRPLPRGRGRRRGGGPAAVSAQRLPHSRQRVLRTVQLLRHEGRAVTVPGQLPQLHAGPSHDVDPRLHHVCLLFPALWYTGRCMATGREHCR